MKIVTSVLMEMRVRTKMLTLEREPIEMINPMNSLWNVCSQSTDTVRRFTSVFQEIAGHGS